MNRTKEYNRYKMFTKALRKRNISNRVYGYDFYENLHQYSKNKIHCSCPCCSAKTNTANNKSRGPVDPNKHHSMKIPGPGSKNWKPADRRKMERMDEQEKEN